MVVWKLVHVQAYFSDYETMGDDHFAHSFLWEFELTSVIGNSKMKKNIILWKWYLHLWRAILQLYIFGIFWEMIGFVDEVGQRELAKPIFSQILADPIINFKMILLHVKALLLESFFDSLGGHQASQKFGAEDLKRLNMMFSE